MDKIETYAIQECFQGNWIDVLHGTLAECKHRVAHYRFSACNKNYRIVKKSVTVVDESD